MLQNETSRIKHRVFTIIMLYFDDKKDMRKFYILVKTIFFSNFFCNIISKKRYLCPRCAFALTPILNALIGQRPPVKSQKLDQFLRSSDLSVRE